MTDPAASPRRCTDCDEPVLGGFEFRDRYGHLGCMAPHALAALASDTISLAEAQEAEELLERYVGFRLALAQQRTRIDALANGLRGVPGKGGAA